MFDLPAYLLKPLIEKLGNPFLIILLFIIWWQYKLILRLLDTNDNLTERTFNFGDTVNRLVTQVEVLIYGKRMSDDV